MQDLHKYYELFDLEPDSSWKEVRRAYRRLAKKWHPDRYTADPGQQQMAETKLKEFNQAYEQLRLIQISKPQSRDRPAERKAGTAQASPRASSPAEEARKKGPQVAPSAVKQPQSASVQGSQRRPTRRTWVWVVAAIVLGFVAVSRYSHRPLAGTGSAPLIRNQREHPVMTVPLTAENYKKTLEVLRQEERLNAAMNTTPWAESSTSPAAAR